MPFLHRWRSNGSAFLLFALALLAPVKGEVSDTIIQPIRDWTSGPGNATLKFHPEFFVSVGCLNPTKQYQLSLSGAAFASIPVNSSDFNSSYMKTISIESFYHGAVTVEVGVSGSYDMIMVLTQMAQGGEGSVVADSQTLRIQASGLLYRVPTGTPAAMIVDFKDLIFSLKPGGPTSGKTRIPQKDNTPLVPTETANLIYDTPDYYKEADGTTVRQTPPELTVGDGTVQCQPGVNWIRVTVPGGSSGSTGVPSWFGSKFPSSVRVTGGSAPPNTFFGTTRRYAGVSPAFTGGGLSPGDGGGANMQLFGNGIDGMNYAFPAGFIPLQKDLVPPPAGSSSLNVDPCFAVGLDLLDRPPPGIGTQDPNEPIHLPDKLLPPELPAPGTLPGGLPGGGTPPGSPTKPNDPTMPGTGPGTGPGVGGPGLGPSLPGEDGEGPSSPGGPLPDGEASGTESRDWAGKMRDALTSIQGKAGGFLTWGEVRAFSPGGAGEWTYTFTVGGTAFSVTIPTWAAPAVRGLLKLILLVTFITATIRLLIS